MKNMKSFHIQILTMKPIIYNIGGVRSTTRRRSSHTLIQDTIDSGKGLCPRAEWGCSPPNKASTAPGRDQMVVRGRAMCHPHIPLLRFICEVGLRMVDRVAQIERYGMSPVRREMNLV